jgi:PadR family transcriptional regulator, regulatory protein PadR
MSAEAQVLKGHLDVLLLAALEDGAQHGYAIKEALRTGSGGRFDLPTGTIYPALHRLERAGLITGSWSVVDGRRRRSYQLTDTGRRRLAGERRNWRAFAAAITALLEHTPLEQQTPLENGPWPATT